MRIQASQELGQFLRQKREAANISQRQVAKTFNYKSSQFVSNWENGKSVPPVATLKRLKEMYKMDLDEIAEVIAKNVKTEIYKELS